MLECSSSALYYGVGNAVLLLALVDRATKHENI